MRGGEALSPGFGFYRTAQAIGWRTVIGYANQPGNTDQLTQAGADAVTTELARDHDGTPRSTTALEN
jgi:hypothetical protein